MMKRLASGVSGIAFALGLLGGGPLLAQTTGPTSTSVTPGSTAFCLYELPGDGAKRRWINLGIVQYVEAGAGEVRVYYGGGGFGSGHDARIPAANMDEALALIEKIRKAAAACR